MVGTNTVMTPGSDAAVLRIRGLRQGLALCTDGPGRAVELDPYAGAARAVAEAARNVACTGARPVAVTDCLNFANPERAPIYYQLSESIRGMADACRAFGTPVVSGNASLYNESEDGPVRPTPVVGMLGVIADVANSVPMAFQDEGDEIWLLGSGLEQSAASLGGSEYLSVIHGREAGPIEVDLDAEAALVNALVDAAEAGLLKSAHDCSDGGLAVAICESAIAGEIGAVVDAEITGRLDAALFGEAGARAVVSAGPGADLSNIGVRIGVVSGDRIQLGPIDMALEEASQVWTTALPELLDG